MIHEQANITGRPKKLSRNEIEKMRQNMGKLPTIRAKEQKYQKKQESGIIEGLISDLESIASPHQVQIHTEKTAPHSPQNLWQKIKKILFNK